MNMTSEQMRELDACKAEIKRLRGIIKDWQRFHGELAALYGCYNETSVTLECAKKEHETAAAMETLKKCGDQAINIEIWFGNAGWWVSMPNRAFFGNAETLELAIALFARKLFSK